MERRAAPHLVLGNAMAGVSGQRPLVVRKGAEEIVDTEAITQAMQNLAQSSVAGCYELRTKHGIVAVIASPTTAAVYTAQGCDRFMGPGMRMCEACARWSTKMKRCARCGLPTYCDKDCQRKKWPEHKPHCDYVVTKI